MEERTTKCSTRSLEHLGIKKIAIIGIAERLDEIYVLDSIPLFIDKSSETLRLYSNSKQDTALDLVFIDRSKNVA